MSPPQYPPQNPYGQQPQYPQQQQGQPQAQQPYPGAPPQQYPQQQQQQPVAGAGLGNVNVPSAMAGNLAMFGGIGAVALAALASLMFLVTDGPFTLRLGFIFVALAVGAGCAGTGLAASAILKKLDALK